ncbi:MAG: glycosyltransferase [Ruminococcaceae bacterium]|nr:glycosyltransferase [Oscillospiraceae bacterium]
MPEIAVSVICTVFNHAKYLRNALDGFVMQKTNFPFEVIVHDDASSDDSAAIIREYEAKYPNIIKAIYQTENQYSKDKKAFDRFLYSQVRGKYFAYCEGDDYWCDPTKLQRQHDALETHPDCYMSAHIVGNIAEDGTLLTTTIPSVLTFEEGVLEADHLRKQMLDKEFYPFQTTSFFFRSGLLEYMENGAREFVYHCPVTDYAMVLCALNRGNCYFINEIMSRYRRNSAGSWSSRQKSAAIHNTFSLRVAESLSYYNELSGKKFDNQITEQIADCKFNTLSFREQFRARKNPEFLPIYHKLSGRQRFFLGCCYYFPPFTPIYRRMKSARGAKLLYR